LALTEMAAGAGIANALAGVARNEAAKRAAAKLAQLSKMQAGDSGNIADTLPSLSLSAPELEALGYVRITPRILPGAKGGSSAGTQDYRFIDRSAEFGAAYEYLLEAVDFNGNKVQYGPRLARPLNPLNTELQSNYPNPFNPVTTLRFSLREKLKVSLVIYDAKGKLVRTLVRPDRPMNAGKYRVRSALGPVLLPVHRRQVHQDPQDDPGEVTTPAPATGSLRPSRRPGTRRLGRRPP
jgi:hypothetical protein